MEEIRKFFDSTFLQTIVTGILAFFAYRVAKEQSKMNRSLVNVQDSVELHASPLVVPTGDIQKLYIALQNVGTRVIYLESYVFNGKKYELGGQILASTYSQALANYYQIELPSNGENHVSLEVVFKDIQEERWSSSFEADQKEGWGWIIKSLGRKPLTEKVQQS